MTWRLQFRRARHLGAEIATLIEVSRRRIAMNAAWRDPANPAADLLLRGARVIDPANDHDGVADVAIRNGRVAALGPAAQDLAAKRQIDVRGAIVTPGFIDMHVHVYEWLTNFGLPADAAGSSVQLMVKVSPSVLQQMSTRTVPVESAPYFPALVASSWSASPWLARRTASGAAWGRARRYENQ